MTGYLGDVERNAEAMAGGVYQTGDVASVDADGYITYIGRTDDVFKASDYKVSPFELESVLIEHPAVAEAAVVPAPDPVRLAVPKAYVVLAPGHEPTAETAFEILKYAREHLAPYLRIRRLEFGELPKTISGKIRRVELRQRENELALQDAVAPAEFRDDQCKHPPQGSVSSCRGVAGGRCLNHDPGDPTRMPPRDVDRHHATHREAAEHGSFDAELVEECDDAVGGILQLPPIRPINRRSTDLRTR